MKCFDVVQTVLDETYKEVPDAAEGRDNAIKNAIANTAEQYRARLMTEGGPDFSDPATRFAYVYRYVPAHSHWLYESLRDCPEAMNVLKSGKARITCIGGGPGSDVVGVLKLLDEKKIECQLFCELIDGCVEWKTTWSDLAFLLDWKDALHTDYVIHEIGDAESCDSPSKISKADIVTLSFFVSEIYHLEDAEKYLTKMLGATKKGAIVLMNDNRTSDVYELMDRVAKKCRFKTLDTGEGTRKIYDGGEKLAALEVYKEKFGTASRLTGSLCWRIYQKQ